MVSHLNWILGLFRKKDLGIVTDILFFSLKIGIQRQYAKYMKFMLRIWDIYITNSIMDMQCRESVDAEILLYLNSINWKVSTEYEECTSTENISYH